MSGDGKRARAAGAAQDSGPERAATVLADLSARATAKTSLSRFRRWAVSRSKPHAPGTGEAAAGRLPLETTIPGVFAAGDVRSGSIKRVASAVGEGSMAVRLVHEHLARQLT